MLEAIGSFFANIWNFIVKIVLGIWNGYISLLSKIFPEDFSMMLAIVTVVAIVLLLFRAFMNRDKN